MEPVQDIAVTSKRQRVARKKAEAGLLLRDLL